jgi:hypothetical protein
MKKLWGWFNLEVSRIVKSFKSGREMILDQNEITVMILEVPMKSENFDEA